MIISYIQTTAMPGRSLSALGLNLFMVSFVPILSTDSNQLNQRSHDLSSPLSESNMQFTFNLHKGLSKDKTKNIFFSPFSISVALAMALLGAKEKTADQIADVLGVPVIHDAFHKSLEKYLSILSIENDDFTLYTANRLFPNRRSKIEEDYIKTCIKHYYTSDVVPLDYSLTEDARKTINDWVSEVTKDKIKNLIGSGVLTPDVVMVLVNAIYFKGNWACQFNPKATYKDQFQINFSEKVEVDMMFQKSKFNFGYSSKLFCSVLEIPYKGESLSMVFILPDTIDGLSGIEDEITPAIFNELQGTMRNDDVKVYLPKFKLETKFELSQVLAKLGMPDAFDSQIADFSGIDKSKGVFISDVIHQAFVEINEEGTEAAAATGIILLGESEFEEPVFRADRPFLFFIKDRRTNMILFSGRFARPDGKVVKDEL